MSTPEISTTNAVPKDWRYALRVTLKALVLFIVLNALYAILNPLPVIGSLSVYNSLVPGRQRLPFGENPDEAYSFSLYQLDAMFASHQVAASKPANEYRVLVIGDSSVWGILLQPSETLAGQITSLGLTTSDGRRIVTYNLGYPTISVTKDLLVLSRAMRYQPDIIVWMVTLEAMPYSQQLSSPIVQNNASEVRSLIEQYNLKMDMNDPNFVDLDWHERTIVGQRREIADVVRLNLYGALWAASGIDQFYPEAYPPLQKDFEKDESFEGLVAPLAEQDITLDVLAAGAKMVGNKPLLIINEPIFISDGTNSDIRYNFYYPRWAYDDYRRILAAYAPQIASQYLDLWDVIPSPEFTNSAIHITPEGSSQLAQLVADAIIRELDED